MALTVRPSLDSVRQGLDSFTLQEESRKQVGNSIRTPRQGKSATSRRIAEAVDNEQWQEFRVSLKGLSTRDKLARLKHYYTFSEDDNADVSIRVDNYIKALCRGGQLFRGESLESMIRCGWNPDIKS